MFVLANRDLELTCDEAVIHRFGATTKKAYAYMLIGMAEQKGKFAPLYSGFSKNATQERIVSIMKVKKSSIVSVALAFVLVATLGVGALSVFAASVSTTDVERNHNTPNVAAAANPTSPNIPLRSAEDLENWVEQFSTQFEIPRINNIADLDDWMERLEYREMFLGSPEERFEYLMERISFFNKESVIALEQFGLTISGLTFSEDGRPAATFGVSIQFYYNNQLVNVFHDNNFTFHGLNDGLVDVYVLRDDNGNITGLNVVPVTN